MSKCDWMPSLVLLDEYKGNWNEYLKALYQYFKKDFVNSKPQYRGTRLALKRHPMYEGKEATFWHLITEGQQEQERTPDLRRCERIRWSKPIIEHSFDSQIKVWQNKRKSETRICLWFCQYEYLVVLAKRKGYTLFWTAYPVFQNHRKRKLLKEYNQYKAKAAKE